MQEISELRGKLAEIRNQWEREGRNTPESMAENDHEEEVPRNAYPEDVQNVRRTLGDHMIPTAESWGASITRPPILAHTFEIKPALIHLVAQNQFAGNALDDPNAHLAQFLQICDTIKNQYVSEDAIRLRLFPFSLRDKAKSWLDNLPSGSITTWETLRTKFLQKFFPPSKTAKFRSEIATFAQHDTESLYEAWERYKELLRKCPHHGMPDWLIPETFKNGLLPNVRAWIDAAAGGSLLNKTLQEAEDLIETMANTNSQISERAAVPKKGGVLEVDTITALLAQNKLITQQLAQLTQQVGKGNQVNSISSSSDNSNLILVDHANCAPEGLSVNEVQDQVNYMGTRPSHTHVQNFANTYHPNWKAHPGFQYGNPQGALKQPNEPVIHSPMTCHVKMEDTIKDLAHQTSIFMKETTGFIMETRMTFKNHESIIRDLENKMGQLSKQMSERNTGGLPSDTVINPKEQCKAVTLRSGKVTKGPDEQTDVPAHTTNSEGKPDNAIDVTDEFEIVVDDRKKQKKEVTQRDVPYDKYANTYLFLRFKV